MYMTVLMIFTAFSLKVGGSAFPLFHLCFNGIMSCSVFWPEEYNQLLDFLTKGKDSSL